MPHAVRSGVRRKRSLPVTSSTSRVERHPRDGWQRARPYRMGRSARRALRGLIWAICPAAPRFPGFTARIELGVRRMLPYMAPVAGLLMTLSMLLIDWAPRLLLISTRRLHQLEPSQALDVVDRLGRSRWHTLRTVLAAIRGAILSVYFDQDEVHALLGYRPVPFINERIALRKRLLSSRSSASG